MIILGIETSCDETALALIQAEGLPVRGRTQTGDSLRVRANITHSQAALHAKYGGVFPNLAKREHSRNLIPLLKLVLEESNLGNPKSQALRLPIGGQANSRPQVAEQRSLRGRQIRNSKSQILDAKRLTLSAILAREPELWEQFEKFIPTIEKPPIDAMAVTFGPGLEPALWVGINFAKALSAVWNIPVIPVNHMEGHIISALMRRNEIPNSPDYQISNEGSHSRPQILNAKRYTLNAPSFPAVALLISGGHTELVLVKKLGQYEIIGETKDDAVGEAFDKVARILGLKYPGGPEISALSEKARSYKLTAKSFPLPRPMLHSGDYNFSFSGLKTAVLYAVKKIPKLTAAIKQALAREFEDAVTEVLISKTTKAIKEYEAKTLIIAGGVIANKHIRASFEELRKSAFPTLDLLIPEVNLSTDNALMIAAAGYTHSAKIRSKGKEAIRALGNLRLH